MPTSFGVTVRKTEAEALKRSGEKCDKYNMHALYIMFKYFT